MLKSAVKYLFIFSVLLPLLCGATIQMPSDSFSTKSGTQITFQSFDQKYYKTLQYLKYADRLISRAINSSAIKKDFTCRIYVLNKKQKRSINIVETADNINIYVHKDFREAKNKYYIVNKMIKAMLLAKTGFNINKCKYSLPSWLVVGIYGRLELRFTSHSILPVNYFPGLKALCQAEKLPDFRTSINTELTPDKDGVAYLLYEELCRFALAEVKKISSRTNNPVTDMVFLTARGKYSRNEVFDYTVGRVIIKDYDRKAFLVNRKYNPKSLTDYEKVQKWFELIANKRLINYTSPMLTCYFVQRFKRFRNFTYIHKVKGKERSRVSFDISKITDIYDKYGMSVGFAEMIDRKLFELNRLKAMSQVLCTPYLERLISVLKQFDNLPSIIIKRRLKLLLPVIEKAFARQQRLEDYLRMVEYENVAPGMIYRNELLEDKRLTKNYCPAVSRYLDKVEKSFMKE